MCFLNFVHIKKLIQSSPEISIAQDEQGYSRLAGLHYEISLIEEARSLMAEAMGACLEQRKGVIARINELTHKHPLAEQPESESSALESELETLEKKIEEITIEEVWLEREFTGRKNTLSAIQQQHYVGSL